MISDFELVEPRRNRILTQYRESPKLLHLIRTYLRQAEIVAQLACEVPEKFDLNIAMLAIGVLTLLSACIIQLRMQDVPRRKS